MPAQVIKHPFNAAAGAYLDVDMTGVGTRDQRDVVEMTQVEDDLIAYCRLAPGVKTSDDTDVFPRCCSRQARTAFLSVGTTKTEGTTVTLWPKFLRLVDTRLSYASAAGETRTLTTCIIADSSMPHLIIGHCTETSALIWVRGDEKSSTCEVVLHGPAGEKIQTLEIGQEHDYTGSTEFAGLEPGADYRVTATFSPSAVAVHGRVRTMRRFLPDRPEPFSFVLSSCNLSVVSINNFLALLAATAGTSLANSSLDLPVERWTARVFKWLRPLLRRPLRRRLELIAGLVSGRPGSSNPDRRISGARF